LENKPTTIIMLGNMAQLMDRNVTLVKYTQHTENKSTLCLKHSRLHLCS